MTAQHNHMTRDIKPKGECPGCDEYHFKPRVSSKPGEQLTVDIEIDDDAGTDEIAAAMQAAAREAGLL